MFKKRPTGFIAIPEDTEFTVIRQLVAASLLDHDIEPVFSSEGAASGQSAPPLLDVIERSDIVIGDLTGTDPNIAYTLGLAHALRKPALLLTQNSQDVPSAMTQQLVIVYKARDTEKLSDYLHYWIRDTFELPRLKR